MCNEKLTYELHTVEPTGHTEVIDSAVVPDCTKTGLTEGKHCSVCDTVILKQNEIPFTHNYVDNECSDCKTLKPTQGLALRLNSDKTSYYVSGIGTATDTEIIIPVDYKNLPGTSIANGAFKNNQNIYSIIIQNSVKTIGSEAFYKCTYLRSVIIPESVTSIGYAAFSECGGLKSVTISEGVSTIGTLAFSGCFNLESVTIPVSVTSIYSYSFQNCYTLKEINYDGTIDDWNNITKNTEWDKNTGEYTVHCSDGDIEKQTAEA